MARKYDYSNAGIGLNSPTETINSPNPSGYDPVSFEGQIRAEEEYKAGKGAIPGGIAEIILYDNDYKRQLIYNKHKRDLEAERLQNEIDLRHIEQDLQCREANVASDALVDHGSRMDDARKRADADHSLSRMELFNEVYDETISNAQELSPAARQMVEKSLANSRPHDFAQGRQEDLKDMYSAAKFNLAKGIDEICHRISKGEIDVEQGLQDFLNRYMAQYVKVLDYDGNVQATNKAFQDFCSSYINFLLGQPGKTVEEIETDVNAFIDSMQNKRIGFLGTDGKIALNSRGEEMSFETTLNEDVALQAKQHLMTLRNKDEVDTDYKLTEMTQAFNTTMGWDEIESSGSSGSFSSMTVDEIIGSTKTFMSEMQQGNFKPSKLYPAMNDIYSRGMTAATVKMIQDAAIAQKDLGVVKSYLGRLQRDLALGATARDWKGYNFEIGKDKIGIPFARINERDYNFPQTTNAQAYAYWKNIAKILEKTVGDCSSIKDLNVKCSSTLREQSANAEAVIGTPSFEKGTNKVDPNYAKAVGDQYRQLSLYSDGKYTQAPSTQLDALYQAVSSQPDIPKAMAVAVANAQEASRMGYSAQMLMGLNTRIGTGKASAHDKLIALAFLSRNNPKMQSIVQGVINGSVDAQYVYDILNTSNMSNTERKGIMDDMRERGIPADYRNVVMAAAEAYGVIEGKNLGSAKSNALRVPKMFAPDGDSSNSLMSNFYGFSKASGMEGKVFVGHPAFGTNDKSGNRVNFEQLDKALVQSRRDVAEVNKKLGIQGSVGWTFDSDSGMMVLTRNGSPIKAYAGNKGEVFIGLPPKLFQAMGNSSMGKHYLSTLYGLVSLQQAETSKKMLSQIQERTGVKIQPAEMNRIAASAIKMLTDPNKIKELIEGKRSLPATVLGSDPAIQRGGALYNTVWEILNEFHSTSSTPVKGSMPKWYQLTPGVSVPVTNIKGQATGGAAPTDSPELQALASFVTENIAYCGKINLTKSDTYNITSNAVRYDPVMLNLAAFNHDGDYAVTIV